MHLKTQSLLYMEYMAKLKKNVVGTEPKSKLILIILLKTILLIILFGKIRNDMENFDQTESLTRPKLI